MDKFQNKYRIPSARLQNWDYGRNAAYFVTICTANRELFFGDIRNGKMYLSEIGKIAEKYYLEIPKHFPFVELDVHQVMPNHVHGIIKIVKPDNGSNEKRKTNGNEQTPSLGVCTPPHTGQTAAASQKWGPAILGSIINQFKRICTIKSRKIHADFAWQSRFHDHIIRNEEEYQRIRNYIINNPKNWNNDSLHNKS